MSSGKGHEHDLRIMDDSVSSWMIKYDKFQ